VVRINARRRNLIQRGCSHALSTSHRNMERAGMRVQFVRSLWTPV
jgi:hypothetical protein